MVFFLCEGATAREADQTRKNLNAFYQYIMIWIHSALQKREYDY